MTLELAHTRRLLAMVWFSAFAMLALALVFYRLSMTAAVQSWFMALAAISGAAAGYAFGGNVVDPTKTRGYGSAIVKGAGVALGAFVAFATLFVLSLPIVERGWAFAQIGNLFIDALIFGFLTGGPLGIIAGGIAGACLRWVGSRVRV